MTSTRFLRISGITLSLFLFLSLAILGRIDPATSAITATTEITVTVPDNLTLSVDNGSGGSDVLMNVSSSDFGSFLSSGVSVYASTNNKTGYTLTFSDTDSDNALVENNNSTLTIPALSSSTPESSFPEDKWGFSLEGSDYAAVPLASTPLTIETTDAPSANTYSVDFGTKITANTPGGTYKDNTVFSLVANYVPPAQATFWTATTMQEFSQDTCDTVSTPSTTAATIVSTSSAYTDPSTQVPQRTLQDTRDNKYYIIRKLADGNCWMAQNLDLEAAGKTLTDQDTDLNSKTSWNGAVEVTLGTTWSQPDYTTARYYSPTANQTGDVGNYYTWPAATAGSVDASYSSTSKEAPDSICPKGWRLPPNAGNKSWNNLLFTTYGLANNATDAAKMLTAPLSFVRSGFQAYNSGTLVNQSTDGFYWSSVAYPSTAGRAQDLYLSTGSIAPQDYNGVSGGFSVRCVTRAPSIQSNITSWCSAQTTPAAFESDGTTINANVPEVTMVDVRDGEHYTIRKLADGNCWMTDNLRLGKTDQTYTINSTNSDVPSTTSFTLPAAATSGNSDYDTLQVFYRNGNNRQTYGNYYNWYTATARTGTQSTAANVNATGSICPRGMTLPLGGNNTGTGSFYHLVTTTYSIASNAAGSTKLRSAPLSFPLAGYFSTSWSSQGSAGYYWSRTSFGSGSAYLLYFLTSAVNPQNGRNQNLGYSVRCLTPGGN